MDALILAAGFGTRLGDFLGGIPKPMLKIGNDPLLAINLDKLMRIGFDRIFVNSHFMHNKIKDFIESSEKYTAKVLVLYEEELLGTAGTTKKIIRDYNPENLLVMHGDNYFEDRLVNLLQEFYSLTREFTGVVGTFITNQPENCGILRIEDGYIKDIYEKSSIDNGQIANSAIYIFNQCALNKIIQLKTEYNDLSTHFIPSILKELKPVALQGIFIDIGTPENLIKARLHAEVD